METAFARSVRISCIPEIIRWGGGGHCLSVSEFELPLPGFRMIFGMLRDSSLRNQQSEKQCPAFPSDFLFCAFPVKPELFLWNAAK